MTEKAMVELRAMLTRPDRESGCMACDLVDLLRRWPGAVPPDGMSWLDVSISLHSAI